VSGRCRVFYIRTGQSSVRPVSCVLYPDSVSKCPAGASCSCIWRVEISVAWQWTVTTWMTATHRCGPRWGTLCPYTCVRVFTASHRKYCQREIVLLQYIAKATCLPFFPSYKPRPSVIDLTRVFCAYACVYICMYVRVYVCTDWLEEQAMIDPCILQILWKISCFRREVEETAIFWVITQCVVSIPYRRFGITYRSYLKGSRILFALEDRTNRLSWNSGSDITTVRCVIARKRQFSEFIVYCAPPL
jgi:hypothetical protein